MSYTRSTSCLGQSLPAADLFLVAGGQRVRLSREFGQNRVKSVQVKVKLLLQVVFLRLWPGRLRVPPSLVTLQDTPLDVVADRL